MSRNILPGYVRVSEILAQWSKYEGVKQHVLDAKCAIGTAVHEAIELKVAYIPVPVAENLQGYIESWQKWQNITQVEYEICEQRFYCSSLKVTGMCDALVRFPSSDGLTIVDYKTSASELPKFWAMQAAFYYYLAQKNGYEVSNRVLFLQLFKCGKLAKVHSYHIDKQLLDICFSALKTYRFFNS